MKDLAGIRAVTFDAGGTLLRPWPSVGHVYAAAAAAHGYSQLTPDVLNRRFAEAWQRKANFDHSRSSWWTLVRQTFDGLWDGAATEAFFDDLYERFARPDAWHLYDDVLPTLRELRTRGFQLGLVSNWDERLRGLLDAFALSPCFDVIAVSREVGWAKPAAEIFRHSATQLRVTPASMLHVGDSRRDDVQGAEQAGLSALWIDRAGHDRSARQISSLIELLALLERPCRNGKLH
jgi:putative hydrolase of the HAD superfamily